jgi:hypothetical protein
MSCPRTRVLALVVAAGLAVIALSGCTAPSATVSSTPEPTPTQAFALRISHDEVLEKLGPPPPNVPLTPERTEQLRVSASDRAWKYFSSRNPGVPRPDIAVVEYVDPARYFAVIEECVAAHGATLPADGSADYAANDAYDLASYECGVQYPAQTQNTLSEKQAGYLYDYWTGFVVPCHEEAGYPGGTEPPTRDYFVAHWPYQDWAPTALKGGEPMMGLEMDQLELMCPGVPAEFNG